MLSRKVKQFNTYASQINVVKMNRIFTVKLSWILTSFFTCWKITKKSPPLPLNLIPSKYPKPINSKCIQYYCTSYLFHTPPPPQWKKNYKCLLTSSVFILFDGDAIFRQHWDYRKLLLIYDYNEQIYVKNTITDIYNLFNTF